MARSGSDPEEDLPPSLEYPNVPSGAPAPSTLDHDELERYVQRLFAREDDVLRRVRAAAGEAEMPQIQIPPATARAIQVLLMASSCRRVLEIGTLAGYSAIWIARALPQDGELITLEVNPNHARVAQRALALAGVEERVQLLVGDARELMADLGPDESFDAVFLDADKERYSRYAAHAARLLRPGGLLLADNAWWSGRVLAPGDDQTSTALAHFNRTISSDRRFAATILPVGDGLLFAVRRSTTATGRPGPASP